MNFIYVKGVTKKVLLIRKKFRSLKLLNYYS